MNPINPNPHTKPYNTNVVTLSPTQLFPYYTQGEAHPNWSVMGISANQSIGTNTSWTSHLVGDSSGLVQPSVVRTMVGGVPSDTLTVFFRDRKAEHVYRATSSDEGVTWTSPTATVLPNNNAGIEA